VNGNGRLCVGGLGVENGSPRAIPVTTILGLGCPTLEGGPEACGGCLLETAALSVGFPVKGGGLGFCGADAAKVFSGAVTRAASVVPLHDQDPC